MIVNIIAMFTSFTMLFTSAILASEGPLHYIFGATVGMLSLYVIVAW